MSTPNTDTPNREDELGALWKKTSKNGVDFYSGEVKIPKDSKPGDLVQIVLFKNTFKQVGDKQPDWRIMKSQPRESAPATTPTRAPAPVAAPAPRSAPNATRPRPAPVATTEAPSGGTL